MKITQQAFDKWVDRYYNEAITKINKGEFAWVAFGKSESDNSDKKKGIILASTKNGKVAYSYRHPDDKWDIVTGLAVAYARYMGVEIPQVEKTYLVTELTGKEVMINGKQYYITPYGNSYFIYAMDEFGQVYHLSRAKIVLESEIVFKVNK